MAANKTAHDVNRGEPKPTQFSLPCLRRLYQYLGEYDALVELTELAARSFIHDAKTHGDIAGFVADRSRCHGISVHFSEFDLFHPHLARSYIVTVYHAAERFLHEFRGAHTAIFGENWTGDSHSSNPLDIALKNVGKSPRDAEKVVGRDLISRFQYYRKIRNWVCHEKEPTDIKKLRKSHRAEFPKYEVGNRELDKVHAPNEPDCLNFEDFVLFTRITKTIAEKLNKLAVPSIDRLKELCGWRQFKPLLTNRQRMKNAIIGRLRSEFGLDHETALEISQEIISSLA